eukprot:106155_1
MLAQPRTTHRAKKRGRCDMLNQTPTQVMFDNNYDMQWPISLNWSDLYAKLDSPDNSSDEPKEHDKEDDNKTDVTQNMQSTSGDVNTKHKDDDTLVLICDHENGERAFIKSFLMTMNTKTLVL